MSGIQGMRLAVAMAMGLAGTTVVSFQAFGASVPDSAMKACAAIDPPAERLACYDRLAGRTATNSSRSTAPPASVATAPVASQPAAPAVAATPPPPPPKEAFGLYRAEHPAAPKGESAISGKIISMGVAGNGRSTVALEGGAVWELDTYDALLASGSTVTISRAALGSFLMTTPSGRTHRVKRLR